MTACQKAPDALRTIGEVAEDLNLATHVIRFWESKFSQLSPQKRRGRRYYRPEDIRTLKEIKSLLYDKGLTIRGAQAHFEASGTVTAANEDLLFESQLFAHKLFDEEKRSSSEPMPSPAPAADPFNRDLFGNLMPAPDLAIMAEPATPEVSFLSKRDLQSLKDILQSLQTLKNRLHHPVE